MEGVVCLEHREEIVPHLFRELRIGVHQRIKRHKGFTPDELCGPCFVCLGENRRRSRHYTGHYFLAEGPVVTHTYGHYLYIRMDRIEFGYKAVFQHVPKGTAHGMPENDPYRSPVIDFPVSAGEQKEGSGQKCRQISQRRLPSQDFTQCTRKM